MAVIVYFLILSLAVVLYVPIHRLFLSRSCRIPGPRAYGLTSWRIAYDDLKGNTTREVHSLHEQYGPVLRIAPNHISFASVEAVKKIYGVGSKAQRTPFYELFMPYGRPTMFTMPTKENHANRKKMLARPYAKSNILRGPVARIIEGKVAQLMQLLEANTTDACEMAPILGFFSLDVASAFIYGEQDGAASLAGDEEHRRLFDDYRHTSRRELSWLGIHGSSVLKVKFFGLLHQLPSQNQRSEPAFMRIRSFAKQNCEKYLKYGQENNQPSQDMSLIGQLRKHLDSGELEGIDVASECADHLLAGIQTTRNLLIMLIWVLSLPETQAIQEKLRTELQSLVCDQSDDSSILDTAAVDSLVYLSAVVKEGLRLYAPLPSSQPRCFSTDVEIDGYLIPSGTTVSVAPYTLHRNADVFPEPHRFNPDRWIEGSVPGVNQSWWPFSSGARACTGMHFAMAEINGLVAAIFSKYETTVPHDLKDVSPAIISRSEVFWDERLIKYKEDSCIIKLRKL